MKKLTIALAIVLTLVALMYGEYRYIMCNLQPYYADGYVYIDFMGQTDTYYAEQIFVTE